MATHLVIRNLKTEKEYPVTASSWQTIVSKGMANRFTIVREHVVAVNAPSFIPPEVKRAAEKATTKEQPSGRKPDTNTRSDA